MVETRFDCPPDLKARFVAMCAERVETPGAMMRHIMKQELKRWYAPRGAKRDEAPDEQLLARLRLRVASAYRPASNWLAFISALEADGLSMRPSGGGLALFELNSGRRLAKASDVGPGYAAMIQRFRAGFPEHPCRHLPPQVLLREAPGTSKSRAEQAPQLPLNHGL